MSLVGIDLGSSSIKVAAYTVGGELLAGARRSVPTMRNDAGHSEIDVVESRRAFDEAMIEVLGDPAVRRDRPIALSFSSSGREVFPVGEDGAPLGPCLMTADSRGDDVAAETAARRSEEEWFRVAGHVPRRMDPVNRALWWRRTHPEVAARARWFMNWHEYYALLLSGRPVVDWSDAGAWAVYDVSTGGWSASRIAETGIDPRWLPEVRPNAVPIGPVEAAVAKRFGLGPGTLVVTGAWDAFAASVGAGGVDPGVVALACGTWHSYTLPVRPGWPVALVREGINICPHPGPTGFGVLVTNPNGMSVIDWARDLTQLSTSELESGLAQAGRGPGQMWTDGRLTPPPHRAAQKAPGAQVTGLTLSSSRVDLVRAMLEAIACDFKLSLDRLRAHGIEVSLVRASGGGANIGWWLQLHADVCGVPVEVAVQEEPGAFGAALLAGVGAGVYPSVSAAVEKLVAVSRRYEPDAGRGALYAERLQRLAREGDPQ